MALTEFDFKEPRTSVPQTHPEGVAQAQRRELAALAVAYKDVLAAAGCAVVAIASLLALPGAAASGWGLSYGLSVLSFAASGGCVLLAARRLRLGEQRPATPTSVTAPRAIAAHTDLDRRREPPLSVAPVRGLSDSQNEAARAQAEALTAEMAALFGGQMQILAERFGVEQARVTEALDLYGQSIQSRLNVSSVALAREFRDTGEHLGKRLEAAGEGAVATIARQGEIIISAIGRSADEVDRRMIERARESLVQLDLAVARTAQTVAGMSESHQRNLAEIAEAGGQTLSDRAAKAVDAIEAKLEGAASSLERMVEGALQRIESRIEGRIGELSERLLCVEKELQQGWAERRDGFAADFAAAASQTQAAMADAAAEVGRAANEAVNSAKQDLAAGLQVSLQQWREAAETSTRQLASATEQAMQTLSNRESAVTDRLEAFENAVVVRSEAIADRLASQSQEMRAALTAMEGLLALQGPALVETLEASKAGVSEIFAAQWRQADARMLGWRETWEQAFATHARILDENAGNRAASLRFLVESHRASGAEDLASTLSALQAQLGAHERDAAANLMSAARQASEAVAGELARLADALGSRGETLRDQIVARQAELIAAIERGVAKTETGLSESLTATAETVSGLVSEIHDDLERRGRALAEALEQASGRVLETVADRIVEAQTSMQRSVADAAAQSADRLAQQSADLQRAMAEGTERLKREFGAPLADTLARIEAEGVELAGATRVLGEALASTSLSHRAQLQQAFAREADALAATVASNAEAFRRDFEAVVAGADGVFVSRGLDLARTLAARVAEMRGLLEGEGLPLLKALDARSGDLSQQIESASQRSLGDFERKATALIGLLTRRGDDLLSAMTAAASESARKVVGLKSDVEAGAARADATLRDVERKGGVILDLIDRRAASLDAPAQGAA